jgi:glycosyltransferase involved in cell wall biosynthesis
MTATPQPDTQISASPRNPWARVRVALDLAAKGDGHAARAMLAMVRHHPRMPAGFFSIYARALDRAVQDAPAFIDHPSDYTSALDLGLRQPFRRLVPGRKVPSPYPSGLALPPVAGLANDSAFLRDAATVLADASRLAAMCIHVIAAPDDAAGAQALAASLADQDFVGTVRVTFFAPNGAPQAIGDLEVEVIAHPILSDAARPYLRAILDAQDSDVTVYLSGGVRLDRSVLKRAAFALHATRNMVLPLVQSGATDGLRTLFGWNADHPVATGRFPYRELQGLNFAAPTALLHRIGVPDARFTGTYFAAREMGWRMHNLGAYFLPLAVPGLAPAGPSKANPSDPGLYVALCPNHWDRKLTRHFERPRVSVYIPCYNAEKYILRAVDSVLAQEIIDLEVCIADDGSTDGTYDLLRRHYADEPRVRVETGPNGGIGHASNRAITMARGQYIGQLDSDDCLRPGAVRRLMEYLDKNPKVACAYASCERVDEDGQHIKNEYSWSVFSREKMMITSITHHFRMFRRSAWDRTEHFREDIVNAVDYDIFLKLTETGDFHHIDEIFYQRRWHGENTSSVNEIHQTANTHVVQGEALVRLGLAPFWQVAVPDPETPRRITYARVPGRRTVMFWPDYSRANPYQHMLYSAARRASEVVAAPIEAALEQIATFSSPSDLTFHVHWLNFVLMGVADADDARSRVDDFLAKIDAFIAAGGRLIWTIHNVLSHDTPYGALEAEMSCRLADAAHVLHFHSAASVDEVAQTFPIPRDKVRILRHGHYIGAYPDFIGQDIAREALGLSADDDVIVFSGQVRPYKGLTRLAQVFRRLLADRPNAILLIVGEAKFDLIGALDPALTDAERARIRMTDRFVDDMEMQVFMQAADFAVYPYCDILTSGSLLLALSFGLPSLVPSVGMTREVLEGQDAGMLYKAAGGEAALELAMRNMLARKDAGDLGGMSQRARTCAEALKWEDFSSVIAAAQPQESAR